MAKIINPHDGKTVGGNMEALGARLKTIELAIQMLQQNFQQLAALQGFETQVNVEAFKQLGLDVMKLSEEIAQKMEAEQQAAQNPTVKIEPDEDQDDPN